MKFEEALKAMLEGKKVARGENGRIPIAFNFEKHQICYLFSTPTGDTEFASEVEFANADRVADDWCVISDIPSSIIKAMEEKKSKALEEIGKEAEKKAKENVPFLTDEDKNILEKLAKEKIQREVLFNRLEITFKSGETIAYNSGEWDDYAYDGGAVIVKRNGAWIGIYNFADVFCVELK